MNAAGSCLCGGVNIVIPEIAEEITVCHCHMCQKFLEARFCRCRESRPKPL